MLGGLDFIYLKKKVFEVHPIVHVLGHSGWLATGWFKAKLTEKTVPSCCYEVGAQDVDALTR